MDREEIQKIIEPVIVEQGLELIDLVLKGTRGRQILRVVVDSETGVQLNECAQLSRLVSDVLDSENIFQTRYTLEVSSPGVERPLRSGRDFQRNIGRDILVEYQSSENNQKCQVTGKLLMVDEQLITLETKKVQRAIPLAQIIKGKVVLPW